MPFEYEYRYQAGRFEKNKILTKLQEMGAIKHGHWIFRVQVFNHPTLVEKTYTRVRDEGHKITMTFKSTSGGEFANEEEIIISDFNAGVNILLGLGCTKKYYYEKMREIWHIDNTEICWDTNPGRPDLMEIESKTKKELDNLVDKLGLKDVPHDDFKEMDLYEIPFGVVIPKTIDLTFNTVKEKLGPLVTKNKELFDKLVDKQIKTFNKVKKLQKNKN